MYRDHFSHIRHAIFELCTTPLLKNTIKNYFKTITTPDSPAITAQERDINDEQLLKGSLTPKHAATSSDNFIVSSQGRIQNSNAHILNPVPGTSSDCQADSDSAGNTEGSGSSGGDFLQRVDSIPEDSNSKIVDSRKPVDCVFLRSGLCRNHEVKGTRILNISKKWVLKNNGLWGYKVIKKTSWKCVHKVSGSPESALCQKPSAQNLLTRDFSRVPDGVVPEHSIQKVKQQRRPAEDYPLDQVTAKRLKIS